MFDSGITAHNLIKGLKDEVDIAIPITEQSYIDWLNSLEQLLYSEVIKEQNKVTIRGVHGSIPVSIPMDNISAEVTNDNEGDIRFEDIHAVYADDKQLIKSTVASGVLFPYSYYKEGDALKINFGHGDGTVAQDKSVRIVYFVKPALKTESTAAFTNVMVPVEFIDLVKAKLRGEAYKVANEDSLAAKWLNDYNILLETFKAWLSDKQPTFGM